MGLSPTVPCIRAYQCLYCDQLCVPTCVECTPTHCSMHNYTMPHLATHSRTHCHTHCHTPPQTAAHTATHCCTATHALQHCCTAALLHTATLPHTTALPYTAALLHTTAHYCRILPHTAAHCRTLPHTAVHCRAHCHTLKIPLPHTVAGKGRPQHMNVYCERCGAAGGCCVASTAGI
jgi:hypothetical protein